MQDFDFDGFVDNLDALDDGLDHGSEYADGFQPLDLDKEQEQWA